MHDVTLELFRQPPDWKQRWRPPAEVAGLRGMHLVPSRVSAAEDIETAPDLCEMFTMSRLGEPGVAAGAGLDGAPDGWHAPNIWPDRPAALRPTWLAYYAAMEAHGERADGAVRPRPRAPRATTSPGTSTSTSRT